MSFQEYVTALHNKALGFSTRLGAAQQLVDALLGGAAVVQQHAPPPLPVLAHYVRTALDWVQNVLLKPQGAAGGQQQPTNAQLQECWQLLAKLLCKGGMLLQGSSISSNLCTAAATATGTNKTDKKSHQLNSLASCLLRVFSALCGDAAAAAQQRQQQGWHGSSSSSSACPASVCSTFRPTLEQQAALLHACLDKVIQQQQQQHVEVQARGANTSSSSGGGSSSSSDSSDWCKLTVFVLQWLHHTAPHHTNPKKVYSVFLGPMLEPLLAVACMQQQQQDTCVTAVAAAALQLLNAVLFDQQHLGGLCEIVAGAAALHFNSIVPSTAAAATEDTAAAAADAEQGTDQPAERIQIGQKQQQQQSAQTPPLPAQVSGLVNPAVQTLLAKTYQGQLLTRLQQLVNLSLQGSGGARFQAAAAAAAAGSGSSKKQKKGQSHRHHQQQQQHAGVQAAGAAEQQEPPPLAAAAAAVLQVLPSLLQGFAEAVCVYKRALQDDAAAALIAAGQSGRQQQQHHDEQQQQQQQQQGEGQAPDSAVCGMPSMTAVKAADSNFAVCLLALLLPHLSPAAAVPAAAAAAVGAETARTTPTTCTKKRKYLEQQQQLLQQDSSAQPAPDNSGGSLSISDESCWAAAAAATAKLLHGVKITGSYRPTQDTHGKFKRLLQLAADLLLQHTKAAPQQQQQSGAGTAAAGAAPAVLLAAALLDVEYRVLVSHLSDLFGLAWSAAAAASHSSSSSSSTPAAFLVHLVTAHSELRQLDRLFKGLFESLAELIRNNHNTTAAVAAAAATVVSSAEFISAVRQAVRTAPTGQAAALVHCVAACMHQIATLESQITTSDMDLSQQQSSKCYDCNVPAFAAPLASILDAVPVDLTTAANVAAAVELLLGSSSSSMWQPLVAAAAAARGGSAYKVQLLLRIYAAALSLHARCAALNPEVKALPGQDINPAVTDQLLQPQQQQQQQQQVEQLLRVARDDYFAALPVAAAAAGAISDNSGPMLVNLVAAVEMDGSQQSDQLLLLLPACLQRLQVLQQRLLRVAFWCPAGMSLTAARKSVRAAAAAEQQQQQQQQQRATTTEAHSYNEKETTSDSEEEVPRCASQDDRELPSESESASEDVDSEDSEDESQHQRQKQQQQQPQQKLLQLWRDEGCQLVKHLLQPLNHILQLQQQQQQCQQQQQQVESVLISNCLSGYFANLVSTVSIWIEFAAPQQLTGMFQVAITAAAAALPFNQQQQQEQYSELHVLQQPARMLLLPGTCGMPAAAAAYSAPSWLSEAPARLCFITAAVECFTGRCHQLALLALRLDAAAAAADDGRDGSSRKNKRSKPNEQSWNATAAGLVAVVSMLRSLQRDMQQQQQHQAAEAATAAAAAALGEVLIQAQLAPLLKAMKHRTWSADVTDHSGSQNIGQGQQQQQQLGSLQRELQSLFLLLHLLTELPLYGFTKANGFGLSVLVLAAITALLHVCTALWRLEQPAGQLNPSAPAAALNPAKEQCAVVKQGLGSCLAVGFRVLGQLDKLGCGLAAVGSSGGLNSDWHGCMVDALETCSKVVFSAAAAAAAGAGRTQQQQLVLLQLSGPILTSLLASELRASLTAQQHVAAVWADSARAAAVQLKNAAAAAAAAAAATTAGISEQQQQQRWEHSLFTAGIMAAAVVMAEGAVRASADTAALWRQQQHAEDSAAVVQSLSEAITLALQQLLLLPPEQQQHDGGSGGTTALLTVSGLCNAAASSTACLQYAAAVGKLRQFADAAAVLLPQQCKQGLSSTAQLHLLGFINAANVTLARAGSSSSNDSSSSFDAVLTRSLTVLQELQQLGSTIVCSTTCTAWPVLPASYTTIADLAAAADDESLLTQQLAVQVQTAPPPAATAAAPGWQRQQQLLVSGVLIGLRDVISRTSRQQQLQLHHYMQFGTSSRGNRLLLLPQLQLLLVVLEFTAGSKSLKLLAAHSTHYTTDLLNVVSQSGLVSSTPAVAAAAATGVQQQQQQVLVSWALRGLASMFGREAIFIIPATVTAAAIQGVTNICQQLAQAAAVAAAQAPSSAAAADLCAAIFCTACGMLVTLMRHRSDQLARLLPLLLSAVRHLLLLLVTWDQGVRSRMTKAAAQATTQQQQRCNNGAAAAYADELSLLLKCAGQLGRLYEAMADQQQHIGRHCHHVITDYIIHMASATPVSLPASSHTSSSSAKRNTVSNSVSDSCSVDVAAAVRGGACVLFGVLGPGDVQGVHVVVGQGPLGSVRRAALAALKKDYEARYKHTGKF